MKHIFFIPFFILSISFISPAFPEHSGLQEYVRYFDNGQLETKGIILNGKKIGIWNFYHENGKIAEEHTYINGDSNMGIRLFSEEGKIISSGFVEDGIQEGEWSFFDESEKLLITINFKNGMRHGLFTAFSEKGAPILKGVFENNEIKDIINLD